MTDGAIAQLGERNTGSVEVGSSILPSSTKYFLALPNALITLPYLSLSTLITFNVLLAAEALYPGVDEVELITVLHPVFFDIAAI